MAPASSKIKYPAYFDTRGFSSNASLTGEEALISILNELGKVADLVESLGTRSKSQVNIDEVRRGKLCNAIVNGSNELTAQFNAAADATKKQPTRRARIDLYTGEAPPRLTRFRNQIVAELQNPLEELAASNRSSKRMIDLKPYETTLRDIMGGVRRELHSWLAPFIPAETRQPPKPRDGQSEDVRGNAHRQVENRNRSRNRRRSKDRRSSGSCLVM